MKKSFAFTLAEVLITLTIVGIIAALTIPTLMKNYQNHIHVVALKKSMHNLQTYIDQLKINTDCVGNDMSCTIEKLTTTYNGCKYSTLEYSKNLYKGYIKAYAYPWWELPQSAKNIDGTKTVYYWIMMTVVSYNQMFLMPDGALYGPIDDCRYNRLQVYLDTNGAKKPNQWGKDIFRIGITMDGTVIPEPEPYHGCKSITAPTNNCAAYWIATHGWKIDY